MVHMNPTQTDTHTFDTNKLPPDLFCESCYMRIAPGQSLIMKSRSEPFFRHEWPDSHFIFFHQWCYPEWEKLKSEPLA